MSVDFSDERISAYLDGELPPAERVEIEALLASSPEHRQLVDELRALRATLQDLPRPVLSGDFSERVMQRAIQAAAASPHEGIEAGNEVGNGDGRGASTEGGGTSVSELALRHSCEVRRWRRAFWSVATVAAGLFGVLVVTNLKHYAEVALIPSSNVQTRLAINSYAAHSTTSEFGRAKTAAPGAPQDEVEFLAMRAAQPDFSSPAAPAADSEWEAISGLSRTSPPERFGMDLANKSAARRGLGDVDGLERAKSAGGVALDDASRDAAGSAPARPAAAGLPGALDLLRKELKTDEPPQGDQLDGEQNSPVGKTGADEQQLAQLSTAEKLNRKRTFVVRLTMPDEIADEDFVNQSLKKNGIDQNLARLNEDQTANLISNGAIASQVYGIQAPVFQAQGLVDELRAKVENTVVYEIPEVAPEGREQLQALVAGNGRREAGSRAAKTGEAAKDEKSPAAASPVTAPLNPENRFNAAPQAQARYAVVLSENRLIQPVADKDQLVSDSAPKESTSPPSRISASETATKAKQDELRKGRELKRQIAQGKLEQGQQLRDLSEKQVAEQQEMVEIILVVDVQRGPPGDKNAPAKLPAAPK